MSSMLSCKHPANRKKESHMTMVNRHDAAFAAAMAEDPNMGMDPRWAAEHQAVVAEIIARVAHAGQVDKAGVDYIEHLKAVADGVEGDTLKAVAWLHDSIEDTDVTAEYLSKRGISSEIVEAVVAMTHLEGEPYFDYIARVKQNPLSRQVKLSDLANNSDLSRLNEVTERDLQRLKKYKKAREILFQEEA